MARKPFGKTSGRGFHNTFPRRPPCIGLFGDGNLFASHREAASVAEDYDLGSPPRETCSPSRGTIPFLAPEKASCLRRPSPHDARFGSAVPGKLGELPGLAMHRK